MRRVEISRRGMIGGGMAALAIPGRSATGAAGQIRYCGVNIAGAEFGKLPGRANFDYAWPQPQAIARYAGLGFNLIRVPFLWERVQPQINAPLEKSELAQLLATVAAADSRGVAIVLDVHNYGKRAFADDGWQTTALVGSERLPASAFADLWARLAAAAKDRPGVQFGLMNEPVDNPVESWLGAANEAIRAIRAEGAGQIVHVPGVNWSGAHSWLASGNGVMERVSDPLNQFTIEVHQYLDADSSGTHDDAVSATIGAERIAAFTAWARARGFKAFLGEFGASGDATSVAALDNLMAALDQNADVWTAWAAWAGGAWWPPNYHFNLEPLPDGRARPQLQVLATHAQKARG